MTGRRPAESTPPCRLPVAIAAAKTEARTVGLMDVNIDAELAADNAERRGCIAGGAGRRHRPRGRVPRLSARPNA